MYLRVTSLAIYCTVIPRVRLSRPKDAIHICHHLKFPPIDAYIKLEIQGISQDLENRCPKLSIEKDLGIVFYNILRIQP